MRRIKGITLISLIITVIILLLLAGVTTSILGGDGIIKNSQKAVDMAKVESMRSQIQMAIINEIVKNDREITIGQIIERLEKEGIIKEGNSNSETGQVKTEPDGYVYEIKEKANGDWEVTYIGNGELTLPELLIALSKNTTGITNSVTITMIAKAESGISSYTLPKGTEQSVTSGTKEITETYTATENGTYTFTVTNGNGKTESKSITIDNILEGTIQISASPTTPTKGNVTVAITWPSDASKAIKEIQVGEGSWQVCTGEESSVDVMVNCTIKARVRNSIEEIKTATCTINNIDKKAPKTFTASATATSNSITVSGSTEDEAATSTNGSSGIGAYYFQIDGGEWVTNTDKTQTSYTFTGLTQGTSYTLKMKAVDNAGNETVVDIGSKTTTSIASLGNITITPSKTTPTNQNITVSVTWPSDTTGYTKKISTNNGSTWSEYTGAVTISANCVVKARLFDSSNQYGQTATCEITNIDKTNPTVTAKTATVTIKEGDSNSLGEYFTVVANGTYGIASTVYTDISNGNAVVSNTNTLAVGTHTIKCTVTKETGASAYASVTIVVESAFVDANGLATAPYIIQPDATNPNLQIVIPAGFAPAVLTSETDGSVASIMPADQWSSITAEQINQGIVVVDHAITYTDGVPDFNEYVWVPITGSGRNTFAREAWTIGTSTTPQDITNSGYWEDTNSDEYTNMLTSVSRNKGFYISRYEASRKWISLGGKAMAQSKRGQMPWSGVGQSSAIEGAANNPTANTHLMYGIEWDSTLNWLIASGAKTEFEIQTDSSSWGNYNDSSKNTGYSETWKANNIYNLAGNLTEWTQEKYSTDESCRCLRGGAYDAGFPAAERVWEYAISDYNEFGFRFSFYL